MRLRSSGFVPKRFLPKILATATSLLLAESAAAASWLYPGWIDLEFDPGNERLAGRPDLFAPLFQTESTLLFANVRAVFDDDSRQEGDFGLGVRHLFGPVVAGTYAFFDLRDSEHDNLFYQVSPGVEVYSESFLFRANGHIPVGGSQSVSGTSFTGFRIEGHDARYVDRGRLHERALPGFDAEIGWLLPLPHGSAWCPETTIFAGGYWFGGKDGYDSIGGPRGRIESVWDLPFLQIGAQFTLGVEGNYDDVRSGQVAGIARLRIPLGGYGKQDELTPLQRRMISRIERLDTVIETRQRVFRDGVAFKGRVISNVETIDGNTADVPDVVANAGVNSLVIADGGAGVIETDATLVMPDGQTFASGGEILDVTSETMGIPGTLWLPGSTGTIDRTDALGPVIEANTDGTLIGLVITGGNIGVFGDGAVRAMVLGSDITNVEPDGLGVHFINGSNDIMIANNRFEISGNSGGASHGAIFVEDSDLVQIMENEIATEGDLSFGIAVNNGMDVLISDNDLVGGMGTFVGITGGATPGVRIERNTVDLFDGIGILFASDGVMALDNEVTTGGATSDGLSILGDGLTALRNTITTTGMNSSAISNSGMNALIADNTVTTGADGSIGIELNSGSHDSRVEGNTVSTAGEESHGIEVAASDRVVVTDNDVTTDGNNANGIDMLFADAGQVTSNTVETLGTNSFGVFLNGTADFPGAPTVVSGNTITGSGDSTNRTLPAANADEFGGGIFVDDNLSISPVGAIITANTITQTGFEADGIFLNIENVQMIGNTITTEGDGANGVYVFGITRNTTVTGNDISTEGNGAAGVLLDQVNLGSGTSFLVSGNTIDTTGNDAAGVRLFGADDAVIVGNAISTDGTGSHGIELLDNNAVVDGSDDVTIDGNTIDAVGATSDGLFLDTLTDNAVVDDNLFDFVTRYVINASGVVNATGSGNEWSGDDGGATLCNGPTSVSIGFDDDGTGFPGSCP